jgi:hypothetical protein
MGVLPYQDLAERIIEGERPLQHGVTSRFDDKGLISCPWPVL